MTEKKFNNTLKSPCKMPEEWGKDLSLGIWSRLKGLKELGEREKQL